MEDNEWGGGSMRRILSAQNRRSYSFISGEQVTISGIGRPSAAKNVISWAFYLFPPFGEGKKWWLCCVWGKLSSFMIKIPEKVFPGKRKCLLSSYKEQLFEDRIWKVLEKKKDWTSNRNRFCSGFRSLKNNCLRLRFSFRPVT